MPVDPARRCRGELLALAVLTPLYIAFGPRGMLVHMALALGFLAYILLDARYTREQVWAAPGASSRERWRGSLLLLAPLTLLIVAVFGAVGAAQGVVVDPGDFLARLSLYTAWAAVQQTLFQFYLQGRLLRAAPRLHPAALVTVNGLAYGLVHLPDTRLTLLTCLAGVIWSADYYRHRLVAPLAVSHALLGTSYYALVA